MSLFWPAPAAGFKYIWRAPPLVAYLVHPRIPLNKLRRPSLANRTRRSSRPLQCLATPVPHLILAGGCSVPVTTPPSTEWRVVWQPAATARLNPPTGGLFGNNQNQQTQQPASGGLFVNSQQPQQGSGGLFGNNNAGGGLFGARPLAGAPTLPALSTNPTGGSSFSVEARWVRAADSIFQLLFSAGSEPEPAATAPWTIRCSQHEQHIRGLYQQ
ncbi:hypothetical protein C8R46DRAFT_111362 [Mycena filopes]|nr:hypothetical protein C8R46DRAFT_111362 [Mycena filopes]